MPGVLLLNPAAGASRGPKNWELLRGLAEEFHLQLKLSEQPGDLTRLAREEALRGAALIMVGGGDDTIREVLLGLDEAGVFQRPRNSRPQLAILPLGTFNNFARHLGLPLEPRAAFECAFGGKLRYADLGQVRWSGGRKVFTESVGVGVDVAAWRVFPAESPSVVRRIWDGALAVVRALTVFRPRRYYLEADGEVQHLRAQSIIVANSVRFSAGFAIAPEAIMDDDHLDLCVIPALSKLGFLMAIPLIFLGKHTVYLKGVRYQRVQRVRIWAKHRCLFRVDGHIAGRAPIEIEVLGQSLPVRVP